MLPFDPSRAGVRKQPCGFWAADGDTFLFHHEVGKDAAARLRKRGDLWDATDIARDVLIGTYRFEDCMRAVEDYFSIIDQPEQLRVAGAAA